MLGKEDGKKVRRGLLFGAVRIFHCNANESLRYGRLICQRPRVSVS